MTRLCRNLFFLVFLTAATSHIASAHPSYLAAYNSDKYHKLNDATCGLCHINAHGGDARNAFGRAFEAAGERFTPLLRAQFPDRFAYATSKVNDSVSIHFTDPDHKLIVLESGGTMNVVDVEKDSLAHSDQPTTTAATPQASAAPTDPYTREGAFFGQNVVDLPNGKPQRKGGVDFWIGHRFPEDIHGSSADLFGFDSFATVAFGFRVGVTDRLSVSINRSSASRTIELGSAFQVSRQGGRSPVTLQVRGTVEGRDNFHLSRDLEWTGYAPSIQIVATRTFADRLSLLVSPTVAFNTRDERFPTAFEFGAKSNHTVAIGLGAGFRVLKTTSLVAEWVPRVHGFRGERFDQPEIGAGIQKATYRHTFQLLFSNARPMTTSRYPVSATDVFGIGFNIYRRLR